MDVKVGLAVELIGTGTFAGSFTTAVIDEVRASKAATTEKIGCCVYNDQQTVSSVLRLPPCRFSMAL